MFIPFLALAAFGAIVLGITIWAARPRPMPEFEPIPIRLFTDPKTHAEEMRILRAQIKHNRSLLAESFK